MKTIIILLLTVAAVAAGQTPAAAAPSSPITQAALEARLAGLEAGRAQAVATVNTYDGAIQECQYWLDLAKKAETAQPAKPGDPKRKPEPPKTKPEAAKRPAP